MLKTHINIGVGGPAAMGSVAALGFVWFEVGKDCLKFNPSAIFSILILGISISGSSGVLAANDEKPLSYKALYTAESNIIPYKYDHHVWVFSEAFAKGFQMPQEWVDSEFKGAEGLAYRVEWQTSQTCGYHKPPHCRRRLKCVGDLYWNKDANIPFRNELEVNQDLFGTDDSLHWLSPQSAAEQRGIDAIRRSATLSGAVLLVYTDEQGQRQYRETNSFAYERRDGEVDGVSFLFPCDLLANWSGERGDLEILIGRAGSEREELIRAWDKGVGSNLINRVVTIPRSFYDRWMSHHETYLAWERGQYFDDYVRGPWWPESEYKDGKYIDKYTMASSELYDKDINIWTYTQAFADRFGMPQKWVAEGGLSDGLALASRVEKYVGGSCIRGYCRPTERCVEDLYLPTDAAIPWYIDVPVNNVGGGFEDRSWIFLAHDASEKREPIVEKVRLAKYIYGGEGGAPVGITAPIGYQYQYRYKARGFMGLFKEWDDWKLWGGTGISVFGYERRLDGIQKFTVNNPCGSGQAWKNSKRRSERKNPRILFFPRPSNFIELRPIFSQRRFERGEYNVEIIVPIEYFHRKNDHRAETFQTGKHVDSLARKYNRLLRSN